MSAGKGDKLRKGANLSLYRDNYDNIFRKKEVKAIEDKEDAPDCSHSEYMKRLKEKNE